MKQEQCKVCGSTKTDLYSKDKFREYYKCSVCSLIFVPSKYYLSVEDEKKRYSIHNNSNKDIGYVKFLSRIVIPIVEKVKPNSIGLDFGCGPGPILKDIFKEHDILIKEYDLFFKNDLELLKKKWDFIITTEVIEHLNEPLIQIKKLWELIKPTGILGIMTQLYNDTIDFKSWYYKGDPTHICFFSKKTFRWIANHLDAKIEFIDKDIIILKKHYYISNKENL